ncbi:hypothetical protein OROGR_003168 [Orobanche gracilis]
MSGLRIGFGNILEQICRVSGSDSEIFWNRSVGSPDRIRKYSGADLPGLRIGFGNILEQICRVSRSDLGMDQDPHVRFKLAKMFCYAMESNPGVWGYPTVNLPF